MVVLNALSELEGCQVIRIEQNRALIDMLVNACVNGQVMDVIFAIGRVEHLRCVVRILFLRHAHIDSNVSIAKSVKLESDLKLLLISDPLLKPTKRKVSQSDACMQIS